MDIKRCEAFVYAVDTNSMSGAAKELGYTPSGIIRLVNALEEEMGFSLLARNSTGVTCTEEGEKLLPIFRQMVELERLAQATGERIRGLAEGTLTVGVLFSIGVKWLLPILQAFSNRYPDVNVNVVEGSDRELRAMLDRHEIDCCIFHGDHSKIDWVPLGQQELVAWLPAGHPLERHASILLAEFDGQPYARVHPASKTNVWRLFEDRGIEPDVRFGVPDLYMAYRLVSEGLATTIGVRGLADGWHGDIVERPLSPRRYQVFGIGTIPAASQSPAIEAFVDIALELNPGAERSFKTEPQY